MIDRSAERQRSEDARAEAAARVAELRADRPDLVTFRGIDLAPALEQQVFFALRDGRSAPGRSLVTGVMRLAGVGGASVLAIARGAGGRRQLVALARSPVHVEILQGVDAVLRQQAGQRMSIVRVGRAAAGRHAPRDASSPRLADLVDGRLLPALVAHHGSLARQLPDAVGGWPPAARAAAVEELPRIALGAMGLESVVRRWRPATMAALDEVGTWARLLPAVGRRYGIPTLDLPHAEAADPVATRGVDYDFMAVYGARSRATLEEAGVDTARIVEIGAPRFDRLIGRMAADHRAPLAGTPRIVYAAGYVAGAMTASVLQAVWRAVLAAAAALAPSELQVRPHPASPDDARAIVDSEAPPQGIRLRIEERRDLHDLLPGASMLVTGWSNSVFEAAIASVPAIVVVPAGVEPPVDFAAEGFGLPASSEEEAAAAARRLLDAEEARRVVARAREALGARIGPLDGGATRRAAELMLALARERPPT